MFDNNNNNDSRYFALEYGQECRCGDAYGKYGPSSNAARDCNMTCHNDPAVMCGGYFFEDVYSH